MPRYELKCLQRPEMRKGGIQIHCQLTKTKSIKIAHLGSQVFGWMYWQRMKLMHSTQTQALISSLCSAIRSRHQAWPMETEGRTFKSFPKERWQKWTNSSSNGRFIWRNCVISPWKSSNLDFQFEWNKRVIGNVSGWIPSKHRWCSVLTPNSYIYLVTLLEYSTSEWVEMDADCSPWLVQTFW